MPDSKEISWLLVVWLVYITMSRLPNPAALASRSSRMEYPLRLKVVGLMLLAAGLGLLSLLQVNVIPSNALLPALFVSGMLGLSGAWLSFESIGTRFDVREEHITRVTFFGVTRVRWVEVSHIEVNRNQDAVVLTWSRGRLPVSLRLLNQATFATAATKGIPSMVMEASPKAALLIRQSLEAGLQSRQHQTQRTIPCSHHAQERTLMKGDSWVGRAFPWLKRTGQLWKMRVALVLLGETTVAFAWFVWGINSEGPQNDALILLRNMLFLGTGIVFFAWMALAFRCPPCRAPVCWLLMRNKGHDEWWPALMALQRCPRCGCEL